MRVKVYVRVPLQFEDVMVDHISEFCRKEIVKANITPGHLLEVLYFKG